MENETEAIEVMPQVVNTSGEVVAAEIDMQIATAKKYPRSIKQFERRAKDLALYSQETAEACFYSLRRSGKLIQGPSVKLAEILQAAWGNIRAGSRILREEENKVVCQGFSIDLETNSATICDIPRRITNKDGVRYNEDMIIVAMLATGQIAKRNAILQTIPRPYTDAILAEAKALAIGKTKSLVDRRDQVVAKLRTTFGLSDQRIFAAVGKQILTEIGWDEIAELLGLGTAVKDGIRTLEDAFPEPAIAEPQRKSESVKQPPATGVVETKEAKATWHEPAPAAVAAEGDDDLPFEG